jgi:hypothetical protein
MSKIVVTGGTGFIGQKLVRRWVSAGSTVTVLARDTRAAAARLGDSVRVAPWSIEEPARWRAELEDAGGVVNLAGAGIMDARWTDARKRELTSSRVEVTRALAAAIADLPAGRRPKVFVSASAVGIYGMRDDDVVVDEQTAPGDDFLAQLCVAWEAAADGAKQAGVRVVHPRLGIVLAADGGALAAMLPPFRLRAGGPIGSGRQWMSWIHWRDAVSACELLVSDDSLVGPYNVVSDNPVTMNELARSIANALHTHAALRVPAFTLSAILGPERARALLTGQRASARRLVGSGFHFAFPDLSPALVDLLGTP